MLEEKIDLTPKKLFFLDTSSFMLNPLKIFNLLGTKIPAEILDNRKYSHLAFLFKDTNAEIKPDSAPNDVYISSLLEWELNNIKDNKHTEAHDNSKIQARFAINILKEIKLYGKNHNEYMTSNGITFPNGSRISLIDYDEKKFLEENASMYEPTRDDRLISTYFDFINDMGKPRSKTIIVPENYKSTPSMGNFVFEIVTEDSNFEGKVYDEIGRRGTQVNCKPLTSERTKSPNPAEQYTGVFANTVHLPRKHYLNLTSQKGPIPKEIIAHFMKKQDIHIDNVVINQFVKIAPQRSANPEEYIYLRNKEEGFMPLVHYEAFMKENFSAAPEEAEETCNEESHEMDENHELSFIPRYSLSEPAYSEGNKSRIQNYFLQKQHKLTNKQKNNLKKRLKNAHSEGEICSIVAAYKNAPQRTIDDKKGHMQDATKTAILMRQYNPLVQPQEEQKLVLDLLLDPTIGLVSFLARQGAGKTYFTLEAGAEQVKKGIYEKMIYIRPLIVTGEDLGYNKGSVEQKMSPHMQSCEDSLEKVFALCESEEFYAQYPHLKVGRDNFISTLKQRKLLEYEVLTYMRGRTLNNAFIIADESQLFPKDQLKLLIGRVGSNSKLVLLGDFGQIAAANADLVRKYGLSTNTVGLAHLIENMALSQNPNANQYISLYGHISIDKEFTKRSKVAAINDCL